MSTSRQQDLRQALDHIVETLVTRYQPEKIILFGSYARGEVHAWSDLDLVIIKDTPQPFFARLKEVALLCLADVGVDYLVYTPAELAQMIADKNPFIIHEVLGQGITLYERHPVPAVA